MNMPFLFITIPTYKLLMYSESDMTVLPMLHRRDHAVSDSQTLKIDGKPNKIECP